MPEPGRASVHVLFQLFHLGVLHAHALLLQLVLELMELGAGLSDFYLESLAIRFVFLH